jgi:hypothetical protein
MRILVTDVLELFAAGLSAEQILEACLLYAVRRLDHPVLPAA